MDRKTQQETAAAVVYATRNDPDAEDEIIETTTSPTLSVVVGVRLSAEDLKAIEPAARATGLGLVGYLRQSALDAAAREP